MRWIGAGGAAGHGRPLRTKGVQTIGGGRNLAEARQPAIIECKGLRVAMLAYCSVLHERLCRRSRRPGGGAAAGLRPVSQIAVLCVFVPALALLLRGAMSGRMGIIVVSAIVAPRWREMDSNLRSPGHGELCCRPCRPVGSEG
jgi:hypothetical protein